MTDLEDIEGGAGVKTRLLEHGVKKSSLGSLLRGQRGVEVDLDTLGNLVLDFESVAEDVGSGPSLGESQAVLAVGPLGLNIAGDDVSLRITVAGDLESDIGGSLGLDLEGCAVEGVVLAKQVIGRLSKVLKHYGELGISEGKTEDMYLPGGGNGLRQRHGCS